MAELVLPTVEPPGTGGGTSPEITLAALVALVVLAFAGAAAWAIGEAHTTALATAEAYSARLVQGFDEAVGRFLRQQEKAAVRVAGEVLKSRPGAPPADRRQPEHPVGEAPGMPAAMAVVDSRRRVLMVSDDRLRPMLDRVIATEPERFRPPAGPETTTLFILRPAAESALPPAPILLGWRVVGAEGGFAVVVTAVDTDQLLTQVGGPVADSGVSLGLVSQEGQVLLQASGQHPDTVTDLVRQTLLPERLQGAGFGSYRAVIEPDGREGLVTFRRVGRFPVAVVAVVEQAEVLRPWRALIVVGILGVFGLSTVVVVLAVLQIRAVARARRDLEHRVRERTRDQQRASERLMADERLTHLGHWEHDLVTGQGQWSDEVHHVLGLVPGESRLGLEQVLAAIHPEDRDAECTARILASAGVKPYDVRFRICRPDGSIRHVHARAEVLRADNDEPIRLFGTILDITERQRVETALAESHAALMAVINASREDSVMLVDAAGIIQVANERAARSFGLESAEALCGRRLLDLVPPEARARSQLRLDRAICARRSQRFEHSRGDTIFDAHLSPALGPEGQLVGVAVFERDITARKQTESDLRLLTRAIEQSPLSVIITNRLGLIEYVNPHFVAATGYRIDEVVGKDPSLFKSGYTSSTEYRRLWEAITSGQVWQGEFHNRMKNGDLHWESASIAPVRDAEGAITHFVAVKEDITRRKLAEIELLAAKERAEAANLAKSRFLATVSHELRTPLNAILGFSEVIRDRGGDAGALERHATYAEHIHSNGTHLLGLINDLLDLAKIEAGRFELHETIFDLEEIVFEALEVVRSRAEAGRLLLGTELEPHLPLLRGDDRAARHILINLLSNAVKFTPEGGSVTVAAGIDHRGLFALSVADTGIGIAAADIPKVLEPFGQVDTALSRRHDGTGLGLPLCRNLIEMHGGHLDIVSCLGAGTTVTVRFPGDRIVVPVPARN
ncbi:MAG: PAS domain S-box protein [Rhodospirillaceae bacterium]